MRILLITDQAPDSNHSAIQGIFNSHLKRYDEVDVVYFDRALAKPIVKPIIFSILRFSLS